MINTITLICLVVVTILYALGILTSSMALSIYACAIISWIVAILIGARDLTKTLIAYRASVSKNDECYIRVIDPKHAKVLEIDRTNGKAIIQAEVDIDELYPTELS